MSISKRQWRLRHDMYEQAVQDAESEISFIEEMFRLEELPPPRHLREDFCGTAFLAREWVASGADRSALGVDLDRSTLKLAKQRAGERLDPDDQERLDFVERDVRKAPKKTANKQRFDAIVGLNFSYGVFYERSELLQWLSNVHRSLRTDGMLMMDATGGSDLSAVTTDERNCGDFMYYWEQTPYNPITARTVRYIHFEDADGVRHERAFTYDWRIWSLTEIQDALKEIGFRSVEVYWEGTDEDGEGNSEFSVETEAEDQPTWIAYIVAWK